MRVTTVEFIKMTQAVFRTSESRQVQVVAAVTAFGQKRSFNEARLKLFLALARKALKLGIGGASITPHNAEIQLNGESSRPDLNVME